MIQPVIVRHYKKCERVEEACLRLQNALLSENSYSLFGQMTETDHNTRIQHAFTCPSLCVRLF